MKKFNTEALLKTHEVTEEHYDDMLGCLPPERQVGNAFLVGEPVDFAKDRSGHFGARYQLFFEDDGKYYNGGLASVSDFDAFVLPDERTDDEKDGVELAEDRKCVRCTDALEQNDALLCGACSYEAALY